MAFIRLDDEVYMLLTRLKNQIMEEKKMERRPAKTTYSEVVFKLLKNRGMEG